MTGAGVGSFERECSSVRPAGAEAHSRLNMKSKYVKKSTMEQMARFIPTHKPAKTAPQTRRDQDHTIPGQSFGCSTRFVASRSYLPTYFFSRSPANSSPGFGCFPLTQGTWPSALCHVRCRRAARLARTAFETRSANSCRAENSEPHCLLPKRCVLDALQDRPGTIIRLEAALQ